MGNQRNLRAELPKLGPGLRPPPISSYVRSSGQMTPRARFSSSSLFNLSNSFNLFNPFVRGPVTRLSTTNSQLPTHTAPPAALSPSPPQMGTAAPAPFPGSAESPSPGWPADQDYIDAARRSPSGPVVS